MNDFQALEKLGKQLVEICFDIPFNTYRIYSDENLMPKSDDAHNFEYYQKLMKSNPELFCKVHQSIMTSVLTQLMHLLDNSEEYSIYRKDGKKFRELSLEVAAGEFLGKEGFINKYSKYNHLLKFKY